MKSWILAKLWRVKNLQIWVKVNRFQGLPNLWILRTLSFHLLHQKTSVTSKKRLALFFREKVKFKLYCNRQKSIYNFFCNRCYLHLGVFKVYTNKRLNSIINYNLSILKRCRWSKISNGRNGRSYSIFDVFDVFDFLGFSALHTDTQSCRRFDLSSWVLSKLEWASGICYLLCER